MPVILIPSSTSFYAQQSDFITRFGNTSTVRWSDLDGVGQINYTRLNAALVKADAYINSAFYGPKIFTLSPGGNLSLGPMGLIMAKDWGCVLACEWLVQSNGVMDETYETKYAPLVKTAKEEIQAFASDANNRLGFDAARRWPVANSPTGYAPQCG